MTTFNALKYADLLKAGKVAPEQADTFARALSEVLDLNREKLATKEDLHREVNEVRKEIADARKDMETQEERINLRMEALEERMISRMTIRLGSIVVGCFFLFDLVPKIFNWLPK